MNENRKIDVRKLESENKKLLEDREILFKRSVETIAEIEGPMKKILN